MLATRGQMIPVTYVPETATAEVHNYACKRWGFDWRGKSNAYSIATV